MAETNANTPDMTDLLEKVREIDKCVTRLEAAADGLLHIYGLHHHVLVPRLLRELGYHFISSHPCDCADSKRIPVHRTGGGHFNRSQRGYYAERRQGPRLPGSRHRA